MTTRKLHRHPYAQATVIQHDNATELISYTTPVVAIDEEGYLHCFGLYSATTRKHISAFMRELGLDYSIAKRCYTEDKVYNVNTGEYSSPYSSK